MTLSSSLVAIGFVSQSPSAFVAAVVPVVFLIGVFTTVRLVDTGVENMASMIGAVNAAVGGVAAPLVLVAIAGAIPTVLALGVVVTLVLFVLFVLVIVYQRGRYRAMDAADRARWGDR
jgi:hypothetical protein